MNVRITKTQLDLLKSYNKVSTYLSGVFSRTYIKVQRNLFTFVMTGSMGEFVIDLEVENDCDEVAYLSVNQAKWNNGLQKFDKADGINVEVKKNLIELSIDGSRDIINLGIIKLREDSSEANAIDTFIQKQCDSIKPLNLGLDLTEELLDKLSLAGSLFVAQGNVNAVGVGKNDVIYADRATILNAKLEAPINADFFSKLDADMSYVYIHSFILGLLPLLARTATTVYFSEDYGTVYWEDGIAKLTLASDYPQIQIPNEEDMEGIIPADKNAYFEVKLGVLKNALNFFTGFYEASQWKPIIIVSDANKEVLLKYRHPTTMITKELSVSCPYDGNFLLDSEALRKVAFRVKDDESIVKINFDEEAPGVLCTFGDTCSVIFAKLEEDVD